MCLGCYKEYGSPKIYNDKVKEAVALIGEFYENYSYDGNLHVQIDDYNLGDAFFKDEELVVYNENAPAEQIEIERKLYALLRTMSEQERASAVALYDGFWNV
jgi:hypothetical protein